jgi:nucleotide-binding universal stress UspA family protein
MDSDVPVGSTGVRTILLGLDGSPEGEAAIELGLRWARATGARLVGLGIVDEPTIRKPEPVPMGAGHYKHERDERLLEDARRRVEEFLEGFAARCVEEGVSVELIARVGLPHEEIVLVGQAHDLVVLPRASHFHFETERRPDDTVDKVLRESARPVVVVPSRPRGSGPVVVAYDGGVHAARALQAFQALGIESGPEVLVVSVHADLSKAVERAEPALAFLASHGIPALRATVVVDGPAAPAILRVVEETDARMLVAGMRDRRRLTELFSGSTTQALLRGTQAPLFLYG